MPFYLKVFLTLGNSRAVCRNKNSFCRKADFNLSGNFSYEILVVVSSMEACYPHQEKLKSLF